MKLEVLVDPQPIGLVSGRTLHVTQPISFWGGVSPEDGTLTDPLCEQFGESLANRVVLIRKLRGSSSGSSILLELIYRGMAPSAIIVSEPDAILALGIVVGREMQWPSPGMYRLSAERQADAPNNAQMAIEPDGTFRIQTVSAAQASL